jgi:ATP-binding cassette, subfamily B (MDR/TAP), member 4
MIYMALATFCSIGFGAGMPGMCILFGDMVDGIAVTSDGSYDMYKESALKMFILGLVMWVVSWFNVSLWNIFAARISHKVRMIYFGKCLELDASFYDMNNPGEMQAKISKEISAISRGLGEKIGMVVMSISCFFFGFGFSFFFGWLLTCILLGTFPFLALVGIGVGLSLQTGVVE